MSRISHTLPRVYFEPNLVVHICDYIGYIRRDISSPVVITIVDTKNIFYIFRNFNSRFGIRIFDFIPRFIYFLRNFVATWLLLWVGFHVLSRFRTFSNKTIRIWSFSDGATGSTARNVRCYHVTIIVCFACFHNHIRRVTICCFQKIIVFQISNKCLCNLDMVVHHRRNT